MEKVIEVNGLQKSYGEVQAVKGVDFYAERGRLFAFLGPNGAGKSTTIDMLCTILKPDGGEAFVCGHALGKEDAAIRASIGVVFQNNLLDPLLTVRENLFTRGGFYGKSGAKLHEAALRAAKAAETTEFWLRPYGKLSGGQRRRADIARALVNAPEVLFLDEPTTGLDPQTRKTVWESVQALQRETGMTVFLTTHYMEEAEEADYVIVIDDGRIAARGTPTAIRAQYASDLLKLFPLDENALVEALQNANADFTRAGDRLVVKLPSTMDALPLLDRLRPHLKGFEVLNGTMDDAFIGITGKEIRE
ncbi:MAG: ATP-binding cassette domain-containing protein [Clostridiaceae bacterium]|nr:ATP-binding cassette domain-containing protein [Eubacteriales bacterium]